MIRFLLGLVLLGLTSIGYADYNWASWYNQNPSITGNLTVGGTLGVTGASTLNSASVTKHLSANSFSNATTAYFLGDTQIATKLAVGTTVPNYVPDTNFDLIGAIPLSIKSNGFGGEYGGIRFQTSNVGNAQQIYTYYGIAAEPAFVLGTYANRTAQIAMEVSGNVGIGNRSDDARLHVTATAANNYALIVSSKNNTTNYIATDAKTGHTLLAIATKTLAELKVYTPVLIGELWRCSDTTPMSIFMSTGTTAFGFIKFSGGVTEP